MVRHSLQKAALSLLGIAATSAARAILPRTAAEQQAAPSSNLLDYASGGGASSSSGDAACDFTVAAGALAFPNARIVHQQGGFVDCNARLLLSDLPAGYQFSVSSASVAGYLNLEPGTYLDKIEVQLAYPGLGGKSSLSDVGSVKNAYGKSGTGYDGVFDISLPMSPVSRTGSLAVSPCFTSATDDGTTLAVELFLSLVHEQIEFDDSTPHYGSVGGDGPDQQLRVGLEAEWSKC